MDVSLYYIIELVRPSYGKLVIFCLTRLIMYHMPQVQAYPWLLLCYIP